MGASNVLAAYALYAGRVPPLSLQLLAYMAVVSKDDDPRPWYGQGHAALAEHALGRAAPIERADIKAVERAIQPLLAVKAIITDRRASVRRDGSHTVRYRLQLHLIPRNPGGIPRNPGDDAVLNPGDLAPTIGAENPSHPPETGNDVPQKPGLRPPETGLTTPGYQGTEETGGTTRSEKTQEEEFDLRTAVTVGGAPGHERRNSTMTMPQRCTHGLNSRLRADGTPSCALCRRVIAADTGLPETVHDDSPGPGAPPDADAHWPAEMITPRSPDAPSTARGPPTASTVATRPIDTRAARVTPLGGKGHHRLSVLNELAPHEAFDLAWIRLIEKTPIRSVSLT